MRRHLFRRRRGAVSFPLSVAALALAASGCSFAPLGIGSSESLCPAVEGGLCRSISEIHGMSAELSSQTQPPSFGPVPAPGHGADALGEAGVVRTAPRVLQVWLAPYVDGDGDYIGGQRIHLVVDIGDWSVRPPSDSDGSPYKPE